MPTVTSKGECYDLYDKGLFGNRALSWDSYEELLESGWRDGVCIRGKGNGIPRIDARYNIPYEQVGHEVDKLVKKGYPQAILRFNQSMPDSFLSIQGEVIDYATGLELTYTTDSKADESWIKGRDKICKGTYSKDDPAFKNGFIEL